ncbi:MAG: hypothetical protein LUQ38_12810 [Methanotrichaceae archaeon]|nr:hypothetical protein [Methanotrichaceae archaeon]
MGYIKVGAVCLILFFVSAILLTCGVAQNPEKNAATGMPTFGEKLSQGGNGQSAGNLVAPGKLIKRNGPAQSYGSGLLSQPGSIIRPAGIAKQESASAPNTYNQITNAQNVTANQATATPATGSMKSQPVQTIGSAIPPSTSSKTSMELANAAVQNASSSNNATPNRVSTPNAISNDEYIRNASANESATNITIPSKVVLNNSNQSQKIEQRALETSEAEMSEIGTDRIWRQRRTPMDYTWTPQTFSGFFYDLKKGVGNETLRVILDGSEENPSRSVNAGNLRYKTIVQDTDYEFSDWGRYQVIGFMAEKYFAGYKGTRDVVDKDYSLINEGQLRKVLIDSDTEQTISPGSVLPLEEGYELRIKEVDVNGNKVYLALAKNGEEIDSKVVSPDNLKSSTYTYKVDIGGEDVPILMAHVSSVFAGPESNLVTVNGLYQVSDNYTSVEPDDKYEKMEVTTVGDTSIEMENEDSFNLKRGGTQKIFGNVSFEVADANDLRFAPVILDRTGTYEVRGTLINPNKIEDFTWSPYNFEGFYYNIDDDIGTENLTAKITDSTKIQEGDLIYETAPQPVKFSFEDFGMYDVIGFLADKYFAGYNKDTKFTDEASAIGEGQLRKVLMDSEDERTISTGSVLPLEEGYELRIKQVDINGNKVYLALAKNGEEVDSRVVTPSASSDSSSTYMYKMDIGGKDVPIIAAHIQSVFRGTEADLATVDGLFQVSDVAKSVEEGESYDKMKVESLGDNGITMQNDDSITLSRDKTVDLMENLKFQVADNSNRDFAPVATKTAAGKLLSLNITESVINRTTKISVRSDNKPISGVLISVAGNSIGITDETGSISFTPTKLGNVAVEARKTGFANAETNMAVMSSLAAARLSINQTNALVVNAPSEVLKGEDFVVGVIENLNQTPMEGANVFFDDEIIGNTSAQGTLKFSSDKVGDHTLLAKMDGYESGSKTILVASPVKVQSLLVPSKARAGQTIDVKANVQNVGETFDTRKLELKVNDEVLESKELGLNPGENKTVTFKYKPEELGTYRITLDDKSSTVDVEKIQPNYAMLALILLSLIVLGTVFYLYETGKLENLTKNLRGR